MSVVRTIVVAYDDPESRTLARAADLAEGLNAALVVTNVAPGDHDSAENVTHYGHDRLEQAGAYLAGRGLDAELVQSTGQPAEAMRFFGWTNLYLAGVFCAMAVDVLVLG